VNCLCTTSVVVHLRLYSLRSAQGCPANVGIALRQHYLFEVELVNCFCATSALSPWIWSRELLLHYISRSIRHYRGRCRLQRWHFCSSRPAQVQAAFSGALHQYYFIESNLVNCLYNMCVYYISFHLASWTLLLLRTISALFHWGWLLLHYIRTISLNLISSITFALHRQMRPSLTSGDADFSGDNSAVRGRFDLLRIHASHYISTFSLRLILCMVFALHLYYFVAPWIQHEAKLRTSPTLGEVARCWV